jgi:hypothetical protein
MRELNMMMNTDSAYRMNVIEVEKLLQQVQSMDGKVNQTYLMRSLEVIYAALNEWPRVFALRVDLRFAHVYVGGDVDSPTCFQRVDPQAMTRFIESLKNRLLEEHRRKEHRYAHSGLKYIWVRELDTGIFPHYHLVLLFNKDHYAFLGDYTSHDANNMATRIQRAWCSALGLTFPEYTELVHFPKNNAYIFDQKSAVIHSPMYIDFLKRMAYLCKESTKIVGDDRRNFGCSQTS